MREQFIRLLQRAVQKDASDIHLKAGGPPCFRVDGEIMPVDSHQLSQEEMSVILDVILSEEQKKVFLKKGEIDLAFHEKGLGRFRVNVFRQRGAVSIVMRRIKTRIPNFEELHLPPQVDRFARMMRGLVLVTGTTGSGKSTTLAAIVDYINSIRRCHVVTIEDPIEYIHQDRQSVINQREIGLDTYDFSSALKAVMRQDPDVILVGEIRDADTAEMAFRAAMTGHQVYATLHTNSAIGAVPRLLDIGILPDIMAGNIIGVVAQRLVRRLCPSCRKPHAAQPHEMRLLGIETDTPSPMIFTASGCEHCDFQGYRGRLAIMELLRFDAEIDELVARRATAREIRNAALGRGFRSLAEDGLRRVLDGSTSIEEVARVVDLTERMA